MPAPIVVRPGVRVPASAIEFEAMRSAGPGGQNVNKVASKVRLHVDLESVEGLTEGARRRLRALAASRLDAGGRLLVVSQLTRDQHRNLEDAREKLRRLVLRALTPPRIRRPSRPTAAARERRLQAKRAHAQRKRARGRPRIED